MNASGETLFLDAVMLMCAAMTLVNLARTKSRGNSAYYLAGAFLILGGTVYAYSVHAPESVLTTGGIVVVALLVADAGYKLRRGK